MIDIIIIGAGPGGFDAALYAAKQGLSVTLIESNKVGGTCLNWGCIPTKALYHNAKTIKTLNKASLFGCKISDYELDYNQIRVRKETIVEDQINHILFSLKKYNVTLIKGKADFIDENTIRVNDETLKAKHIIIATGSKPKALSFKGDHYPIIHDSKTLLELNYFPKKLLVVGAGVIGCEMAQIFEAFGAQVTLIDFQDDILLTEDYEIRKRARNLFKRHGIDIKTNAALKEVTYQESIYKAHLETPKESIELEVDAVLLAVGRVPNKGGLNLDLIGIKHQEGIHVNEYKQTSLPHIYAIGDVNNELLLAHKASYDGYRAINHILNIKDAIRFDLVPSVIFSTPLIASVGVRETSKDSPYKSYKALFKGNINAVAMDDSDGFIKLVCDQQDNIIGAHIIGNSADTLIHEMLSHIQNKKSLKDVHDMIHAHPTVSEIIHEVAKQK